ncbi:MAG: restriction endonuclease subunit S [Flavobacterium sp.]|uniref:restriction endonuclease subunit S n=1 Tax=Myroides marinus TaxID=703342 RepID=UPI002576AD4B|nr:restriction endonuclease subunit S [Myroides marinus]MDM1363192.1 restriction endonuclease subunit S [Myroides marinus]MDM1372738.1 restriction endonuclease subunit S [Myroides marinus]
MWEKVRLGDYYLYQEGPGVRKNQFKNKGVKLLNVGNINNNKLQLDTTDKFIDIEEANNKYKHFLLNEGDLVIACSGIVVTKFESKIAFVEKSNLPLCLNTSTMRFNTIDALNADIHFLYYYLQTLSFKKQIGRLITGSAQLNFGPSHIKQIEIPLPPLEIQQQIVAILNKADRLRQLDKAIEEKYDALAQSIFIDMFGDPVKNEKGWEVKKLGDLCSKIYGGGTPSKTRKEFYDNGTISWITPKDMKTQYVSESLIKITKNSLLESSVKLIPKGALLMVIRSGILKRKLPIAINNVDVTINQDMKGFVFVDEIKTIYMFYFFKAIEKNLLTNVRAVTADNIEFNVIRELKVITPSIELQNEFARKIVIINQMKEQGMKGEELFQALLQKAFKGELVS